MNEVKKIDAGTVETLVRIAGLPVDEARLRALHACLPGFRERVERLYRVDVTAFEFDFLHPLR